MRSVSAPFEGSGASTRRRYKLAMVLCRASETTSASVKRNTCCHCGLCRCRCKPYIKASSLGECCTMSLSKGISFLLYALVGTPSVHGYPLVFNLGYTQKSPDSKSGFIFPRNKNAARLARAQKDPLTVSGLKKWVPDGAFGHELSRPKRVSWLPAYGMMYATSIPVSSGGVKTNVFMNDSYPRLALSTCADRSFPCSISRNF